MRKCVLVSLALLLSWGTLFAQDEYASDSGGGYFDAGNLAFEITGTPFTGESLLDFGSFRARYAVTTKIVPRIGMNMGLYNDQLSPDVVVNSMMYTVAPGCEYHFRIENGFRSYAALDFLIGQQIASLESTTQSNVSGATYNPAITTTTSTGTRGYLMYGVGLGVGADYHFGSNFYIGAEIGFRFTHYDWSDIEVDGELFEEGIQSNSGTLNTMNALRIGFKFL